MYVPALLGLGTPYWDYGARGTLLGITRGTERPHIVRAVLEGVAQRGADLVDAAEADGGHSLAALRIDGGMAANGLFVQALANCTQKPVEVSPQLEATTLGAGFLAGLATGTWASDSDVAGTWRPARVVEPAAAMDRDRWRDACTRAASVVPRALVVGVLMATSATITPQDATLAAFAQSIALAAADVYDKAAPLLSETAKPTATAFALHHRDHAAALAKLAGAVAATVANQTLTAVLAGRLQAVVDERGALTFAFDLENQVAATYEFMLTTLTSSDVIQLVATIVPVIAGQAAIAGSSAGVATSALFPNGALEASTVADGANTKVGFDPALYPVT